MVLYLVVVVVMFLGIIVASCCDGEFFWFVFDACGVGVVGYDD